MTDKDNSPKSDQELSSQDQMNRFILRKDPEQEAEDLRRAKILSDSHLIDQQASEGAIVEVDMETAIAMGGFEDDAMELEDALEARFNWEDDEDEDVYDNQDPHDEAIDLPPEETGEDDPRNYPDYDPEIHETEA